jgi:hypothetical protein
MSRRLDLSQFRGDDSEEEAESFVPKVRPVDPVARRDTSPSTSSRPRLSPMGSRKSPRRTSSGRPRSENAKRKRSTPGLSASILVDDDLTAD